MTDNNKKLADFEEKVRECVKCGVCQAHCPVYRATKEEGGVARGKIALAAALLDHEAGLEKRLQEAISLCLMCGSCVDKCPNRVPTPEIVGAIRREITGYQGLSLLGKGVSAVLSHQGLMRTMSRAGAAVAPLLLKNVPESSGLRLRFPSPVMKERTVPKPAFRTLFDRVPECTRGRPDKPVVGFFAGCAITYLYPEIGKIMVDILSRMGHTVFLPRSQRCCGIPALSAGDGRLVQELQERNRAAFAARGVDYIVTACASCNGGIGEYYRTMKTDLSGFTDKVIDFSVFLKQQGLYETLAALPKVSEPERIRVTYHDPCHLKTQGITREPREFLQSLPHLDFVEMENASLCCGLGGTFSVSHYETSKAIGAVKVPAIDKSGAELVATACPGCIMQLQDSLNHGGRRVRVVHILELVAPDLDIGGPF